MGLDGTMSVGECTERGARRRVVEICGLGLASMSVLGSQIAMTRILSVKYASNQTFLVVSFAVLGLAMGAAIASALARRQTASARRRYPCIGMLVLGAAMSLVIWSLYANLPASGQIVLVPLPYIGVGLCIASLFSLRADHAGLYYAGDLIGASLGAFGAAPILDILRAPTAMILFVVAGLVSALLFAPWPMRLRWHGPIGTALLIGLALVVFDVPGSRFGRIPIYEARIKDMLNYIERGRQTAPNSAAAPFIEESRWSSFGRTDVVNHVAAAQRKMLFVDGAAGTAMYIPQAQMNRSTMSGVMRFGPSTALRMTPRDFKRTALAIGAGGGRDVLACVMNGVGRTVAVELNHDIVRIVQEQSAFNGGLYGIPGSDGTGNVKVVAAEGRHYLRSTQARFDVIVLAIPVTKRGEGYGGFALSESYLFTVESIKEYLAHLNEAGQLIIVCHTRQEVGRLINTYLAGAAQDGLSAAQAMQRVGVFGDMLITVVIADSAMPEKYWWALDTEARRIGLADPSGRWYYMPHVGAENPGSFGFSEPLLAVARGEADSIWFDRSSDSTFEPDSSAVTDDRPFFYFFTGKLPPLVRTVLGASGGLMLVMSVWGLWNVRRSQRDVAEARRVGVGEAFLWRVSVMGLGAGFMLAEIPLIQRFVFWFGHPTLALGLLLGVLLLATGVGSLASGLWIRGRLALTWPFAVLLGVFLFFGFGPVQGMIFGSATGEFGDSLGRAALMTVPLGLVMGVPFPMLLTAAHRRGEGISIAMLWGVNGVAGVLGSAGAIAIAMMWGYSGAFALSGAVYVLTGLVIWRLSVVGRERSGRNWMRN